MFAIVLACGRYAGAAPADPKQIYDPSTDALYNLDFNIAQRGYETLTHDYPDNPDYWNALASSIWSKISDRCGSRAFGALAPAFAERTPVAHVNRRDDTIWAV